MRGSSERYLKCPIKAVTKSSGFSTKTRRLPPEQTARAGDRESTLYAYEKIAARKSSATIAPTCSSFYGNHALTGVHMPSITTKDGTEIFYKDWGSGQPIVFSHGWPLSADDWDAQLLFFLHQGYRVIAHDRRGHGRSTQTADGHDMDHYADALAALAEQLDLQDAVHIGHSTGGGEVVRYLARHGERRVAKAVLISAVPPIMVQTPGNPGVLPKSVFDGLQEQVATNRSAF